MRALPNAVMTWEIAWNMLKRRPDAERSRSLEGIDAFESFAAIATRIVTEALLQESSQVY